MPRIRTIFEKKGWIIFINHMDLPTIFGRAARRAGIRPEYTQGFSPRPRMSMGPALAAGVEGNCEVIDFWLEEWNDSYLEKWNAQLPEGLKIITARELDEIEGPLVGKVINVAEYEITTTGFQMDNEMFEILQEAVKEKGELYYADFNREKNIITLRTGNVQQIAPSYFVKILKAHEKCEGWTDMRFTRTKTGVWNYETQTIEKA